MSRVRFDRFQLDLASGELSKEGTPLRLQPQPLRVLTLLVRRAGQLVTRNDIQKEVWTDNTFVDFNQGLNYCIRQIRTALGDDADAPRYIETVPRRGYRFLAPVKPVSAATQERLMLAVLPFGNLSGDAEQEYFSDGLTEEMISQLGRLNPHRLGVIARTSAMRYKHTDKSIATIGQELGVSFVLEGSVRRAGDRVRVTAQLVHVADQAQVWADSFDRQVGNILALHSDFAHAIATQIGVQLAPNEQVRLASPPYVDAKAYEAYLKGRYFWKKRSREALQKSVLYFKQAIAIDAAYAPAYAGLADVHLTQLDYNYLPPREAFALADQVLLDALRLDNTRPEPHASLGHLRLHQFDWTAAERHFTRAIELNPGYDTAYYYYGNLLAAFGRFDEALAEANRSIELDPLSPNTRQNRLFILYLARRYEEAVEEVAETIEMDPGYTGLYYYLGLLYERQGRYVQASEAFHMVSPKAHSRGATVLAAIGYTHARAGDRDAAIKVLKQLEELAAREYVSPYDLALLHLALGDPESASACLWKAYDAYSSFLPFANVDARLDEIRGDPRFQALLDKLNVPTSV
jgi:TolB-like protein/Flp pilus assembly protein TadD